MHLVIISVLLFSTFVSTFVSIKVIHLKNKKWLARITAIFINTFILSGATVLLYKLDIQTFHKQSEGLFDSLGIVVLLFYLPIVTLINFYILEFVSNKRVKASI